MLLICFLSVPSEFISHNCDSPDSALKYPIFLPSGLQRAFDSDVGVAVNCLGVPPADGTNHKSVLPLFSSTL